MAAAGDAAQARAFQAGIAGAVEAIDRGGVLGFVGNGDLGPYADVGVGIDFQLTRVFSLGFQAAYNTVLDDGSGYGDTRWASFGLNFGFDFTRRMRERMYVTYY